MHKNLFKLVAGLVAIILLLSGCEMPTRPTTICDWLSMPTVRYVSPDNYSVIDDLRPTITWTITPGDVCVPAQYSVEVWSAVNYLPGASAGYLVMAGTATVERFDWPAGGPDLLPGHSYYVHINQFGLRDGELYNTGGTFGYFSTGPLCASGESVTAPTLRWPPDNWRVDPTGSMEFEWDSAISCWPTDNYFIEISRREDFSDPIVQMPDLPLEDMWLYPFMGLPWENCVRYFWHVRPNMPGVEDEPFSETWSFVTQPGDTICPPDLLGPYIPPEAITPPIAPPVMPLPVSTETTPTVDCTQYNTNPAGCNNNPACWWDASVPPNGVCKNR